MVDWMNMMIIQASEMEMMLDPSHLIQEEEAQQLDS